MPTNKTVSIHQSRGMQQFMRAHSIEWPLNHADQVAMVSEYLKWEELDFAQKLDVSQSYLASLLDVNGRNMRRWLAEPSEMPDSLRHILNFFVEHREAFRKYQAFVDKGGNTL